MMERVNPKEVSPLSAAPIRRPQAAIAGPGKKGEPLPWQLTWFNDAALELWRAWSPFPQLKPQEQVARLDRPALEKRSDLTDSREHVEPQTSLDRMLHASALTHSEGAGRRLSFSKISSAVFVQTKGLA